MYKKFFKRLIDIVGSFFGLLLLSPIMIVTAIAIKIDSKGPSIFSSQRAGKNLKPFNCYKFRSMRTDAPDNVATKLLKSEDYITKVGKFIRKTSIDELPQLFNILKGDMSIVGPRPSILSEADLFEYRDKYGANGVTPGLTGLAQISGRDILAKSAEEKAKVDGEYCKKITFIGDMKIIFTTAKQVIFGKDVVEGTESINVKQEQDKLATTNVVSEETPLEEPLIDNTKTAIEILSSAQTKLEEEDEQSA